MVSAHDSFSCTAAVEERANVSSGVGTPSALILEPSRDLAQQTHDAINSLKRHLTAPALQSVLLVGGTQPKEAARQLERGADIVTGTPGAALLLRIPLKFLFCSSSQMGRSLIHVLAYDEKQLGFLVDDVLILYWSYWRPKVIFT